MAEGGLSSGLALLVDGARSHFAQVYQSPRFHLGEALDKELNWLPSLHFRINRHLTIICEASENPYPLIFRMRRLDIIKLNRPVAIYSVCPEEAYLSDQLEAKSLINDGYGLLTVDAQGNVQKRASCIPLLQQINDPEFTNEIRPLPRTLRTRLAEAFERYKNNAPSGSADIAEVMEGLILKAGREAAKKNWIPGSAAKPGSPAATLSAMQSSSQFQSGAAAAVGAAQAYISMYRNTTHHFPKDSKQAAIKYRDCRHSFIEGLKKVIFVRESFKKIGLTGNI